MMVIFPLSADPAELPALREGDGPPRGEAWRKRWVGILGLLGVSGVPRHTTDHLIRVARTGKQR
jgi:hypothetical protein